MARPVQTLHAVSLNVDVAHIAQLAGELEAKMIIVGDPIHMSGDPSMMSGRARKYGDLLAQRTGLPVVYWDERLTTVEAQRILARFRRPTPAGAPTNRCRSRSSYPAKLPQHQKAPAT